MRSFKGGGWLDPQSWFFDIIVVKFDAARAEKPDETSGCANREEDSQSEAAPVTETVPLTAVVTERGR